MGVDKWDVLDMKSTEKAWSEKNVAEKATFVAVQVSKVLLAILLLYLFIVSLGLMGSAFKILAGPTAGEVFRNNDVFDNPFAGLMLGILATVLVQSSSTSTSIIISMTAALLIEPKNAIPMIMGANIGTSVTNTIVSMTQIGNKQEYRRAFAGATVHDCFNWLTVAVLLPVEIITGLLLHLSGALVDAFGISDNDEKQGKVDFLKMATKPITSRLVQVDKKLVTKVAVEDDLVELEKLLKQSMVVNSRTKDSHMFMDTPMNDSAAGLLLLFISLALLSTCLILLVKILQSIFRGRAAIWMQGMLNLEIKSMPFVGDYILLVFGAGLTILMQSSSITTSTLTPLVGIGLIKLDKMFPFTVGANIGTCVTGILSSLASSNIAIGMRIALAHLLFNIFGTLIWFPVLRLRRVPLAMARQLGSLAADLPWFPIAYICCVFFLFPSIIFGLSLAGVAALVVVGLPMLFAILGLVVVISMRNTYPNKLPAFFQRNPRWLPESLKIGAAEDPAEVEEAAEQTGNADFGLATMWAQAPAAWGLGWVVILMLLMAVPNAQWGNMKYLNFDEREHVGVGAWSACSKMYEDQVVWAAQPARCDTSTLNMCAEMSDCSNSDFSDKAGANEAYEKSWLNCTSTGVKCMTNDWYTHCTRMGCGGSLHQEQCYNVSKAVEYKGAVDYGPAGTAVWNDGDACRPLSMLCDNSATLGHAGSLAVTALVFSICGQLLLLAYQAHRQKRDMRPSLVGSLVSFASGWFFLLLSWAVFAAELSNKTTCTVMDVSKSGAIKVTGPFGDIINERGSYTFAFVIGSFVLLTPVIGLVVQRVLHDYAPKKEDGPAGSSISI